MRCLPGRLTLSAALLLPAGLGACDAQPTGGPASPSSPQTTSQTPRPSSPGATPAPAAPARSGCVRRELGRMSLAERAGQVLMVGVPASSPHLDGSALAVQPGGVFLARRSSASVGSVRSRTDALRAAAGKHGPGLLVAVDQEGGQVQTLQGSGFGEIPSALEQGRFPTATLEARTRAWAGDLTDAGISMNLAPVADTVPAAKPARNPPIGRWDREYGHDPATVGRRVSTVVAALTAAGVQATVKHFPGLGRVRANTDTDTGAVDRVATGDDDYLAPFQAGIEAGAGAVMISSATYPGLDPASIAAFSPAIITGLLRGRLDYQGLVISDDLGLAAAVKHVPVGRRAVRFVRAGGDLVLTVQTADAAPMRAALVGAARESPGFRSRLDSAAGRVLALKERAGLLDC